MKVVITGGAGRIGRYVASELKDRHETIIFDRIKPPSMSEYNFITGDIMCVDDLAKAFEGVDAVVHLAAIPDPLSGTDEDVYRVNTAGTFNALLAAEKCNVKRFVCASSDSAMGFVFKTKDFAPEYLPFDEEHPLKPQDSYGLSKLVVEEICKAFGRKGSIQTVAIRIAWVWFPEFADPEKFERLMSEISTIKGGVKSDHDAVSRPGVYDDVLANPEKGKRNYWGYIHVNDAAQSFRLAVEAEGLADYEVFLLTADDTCSTIESMTLMEKFYPQFPKDKIRKPLSGCQSFYDNSKAKKILGFQQNYSWRDLVKNVD